MTNRLGHAAVEPAGAGEALPELTDGIWGAVAEAHRLIDTAAVARRSVLAGEVDGAHQAERARAVAYYADAVAAIERRLASVPADRRAVLAERMRSTREEEARRLAEIAEKYAGSHAIRPYRVHVIAVPALRIPADVRRGDLRYPMTFDWLLPVGAFAPVRCPSCGSEAPLAAGKQKLGCETCLPPRAAEPVTGSAAAPKNPPAKAASAPKPSPASKASPAQNAFWHWQPGDESWSLRRVPRAADLDLVGRKLFAAGPSWHGLAVTARSAAAWERIAEFHPSVLNDRLPGAVAAAVDRLVDYRAGGRGPFAAAADVYGVTEQAVRQADRTVRPLLALGPGQAWLPGRSGRSGHLPRRRPRRSTATSTGPHFSCSPETL